jgi:hypothetical protein
LLLELAQFSSFFLRTLPRSKPRFLGFRKKFVGREKNSVQRFEHSPQKISSSFCRRLPARRKLAVTASMELRGEHRRHSKNKKVAGKPENEVFADCR